MTLSTSEIKPVSIEEEMKGSYLDYAMSVIVGRALPDVRDGLKPVHRRILYSMKEAGYDHTKPYRKSARIVGDVMGKYHPHGDSAIYDSMVRMAQDFSMSLMLVDGQGNFGSMDGDPPAAMRYTEARLAKSATALLNDLDKDTVDFQSNYDDTTKEPLYLPAEFPNLLVNGSAGIAVGMATNIPPHNFEEILDACCALIDNPHLEDADLFTCVKGPDFPTGGIILGRGGILSAYMTGRGSIRMRASSVIEPLGKDREAIIVTEIPYQQNKSRLMERIAEVVRDKIIEGISDLRDESNQEGVRIVIELKKGVMADVILNQLYKHTPLQTSFGANMLAIKDGRPEILTLRKTLEYFLQFREETIIKRTHFLLNKAKDRAHILLGLAVAVLNIDEIIALIKSSKDPNIARQRLLDKAWPAGDIEPFIKLVDDIELPDGHYHLNDTQARAILDLRLHRLTGLEREKIENELNDLMKEIEDYLEILGSRVRLFAVMKAEMLDLKARFPQPRRTRIEEGDFDQDDEDLIQQEDMIVTVSHNGYIKRVPLDTFRAQRRGGRGRSGMATREEDVVSEVMVANTHTPILFFTNFGRVYQMKVYKLPLGTAQSRGKAIVNLLPLSEGEKISTVMPMPIPENEENTWEGTYLMFSTSDGKVRRNAISDFINIKANGKIAMKLEGDETLVDVLPCTENDDILLSTKLGKCIRFAVEDIRVFVGRNSVGVRGVKLGKGDQVISMSVLHYVDFTTEERDAYLKHVSTLRRQEGDEEGAVEGVTDTVLSAERIKELEDAEQFILTVSERGFGKRTSAYEYRRSGRGGQGIGAIATSARNGCVVASFPVEHSDQIILVTDNGRLIRCPIGDVRIAGRMTQGVTLFKVDADEKVVSVSRVGDMGEEDMSDAEIEAEGPEGGDTGSEL